MERWSGLSRVAPEGQVCGGTQASWIVLRYMGLWAGGFQLGAADEPLRWMPEVLKVSRCPFMNPCYIHTLKTAPSSGPCPELEKGSKADLWAGGASL